MTSNTVQTIAWVRATPTPAGREYARLDDTTSVVYNPDQPTIVQVVARHAAKHGGRILLPVTGHIATRNLRRCDQFVIAVTGGEWVMGDIDVAGPDYKPELQDRVYTTPSLLQIPTARNYVKLRNVTTGTDTNQLDPDQWVVYRRANPEGLTLTQTLTHQSFTIVTAYRWPDNK